MNLIGHTCIPSFITTKCLNENISNPFSYAVLDFNSVYNLVKDYDIINWFNYELIKDKNWNFYIIIDNKIKIWYGHYKFDKNVNGIITKNNNVYSNKIWEYIVEKYETRVKRMLNNKESPIFIFASANNRIDNAYDFSLEQQTKLIELNSPYKIIFSFKKMIPYKFSIKQNKSFKNNGLEISKYIYEQIKTILNP